VTWLSDDAVARVRAAASEPDLTGTRYRLVGPLASGGMASVWIAEDTTLGRTVALKVLDEPDQEARTVARLEHPSIVPVHDAGSLADGRAFVAMKYVEGRRFDDFARDATPAARLRAFQRICEAAAFAHARGIVHRDLKPQNVVVGEFGEVVVLDWGLARPIDARDESRTIAGTPGFMAPEQARGESARVDARADVYALGAILQGLLADSRPAKRIEAVRRRAMAPEPEDRYPDASALAADVARFLDGLPVSAYRESAVERLGAWAARNRAALLLVAAYLAMRAAIALLARV